MNIYFVRHGKAVKRSGWTGWDDLRPLTKKGEDQARGVQATLATAPIRRIYSSHAIRCHETVERLAADRSLLVELDSRLDGEADVAAALDLLEEEIAAPILICASRSLITAVMRSLGVGGDDPDSIRCQKGSIWVLERRGQEVVGAEYIPPRAIEGGSARTQRLAVLDIGSASMSLLVADVRSGDRAVEPVLRERAGLRFGATTGEIDAADCDKVVKRACAMRAEAESVGSEELLPVATAGLRNAPNGREIADRIGAALETPVRLLSGAEEARFAYTAAHTRLALGKVATLALDLGGGSLDLASGCGEEIRYEASEPLGVTRLRAELVDNDPMKESEIDAIRGRVTARLRPHLHQLLGKDQPRCVAAGGTVRALARLVQASRGQADIASVRGLTISRAELAALNARLRRATRDERMKMPTVRARRVDLLPTGAIILATLLEQFDLAELTVSDWGLREGVLLAQ